MVFAVFPRFFLVPRPNANCILWDRRRWERLREDLTDDALVVELKPYEAMGFSVQMRNIGKHKKNEDDGTR